MNSGIGTSLIAYLIDVAGKKLSALRRTIPRTKYTLMSLLRYMEQPRLYVLVRNDIDLVYQGVQAGHAAVQFILDNPESEWKNHFLIYLSVNGPNELEHWKWKLQSKNIKYSEFNEPDIGNQTTAIAVFTEKDSIFKNLSLMGDNLTKLSR